MYRSVERLQKNPRNAKRVVSTNGGGHGYWDNGDYLYDEADGPGSPRRRVRSYEWQESAEIEAVIERVAAEQQVRCNVAYWNAHTAELDALGYELAVNKLVAPRLHMAKP